MQSISIGVTGEKFFTDQLVKFLVKNGVNTSKINPSLFADLKEVLGKDVICFIYSPTVSLIGFLQLLRLKMLGKKIFVLWIGSDVLFAKDLRIPRALTNIARKVIDVNLADARWLAEELGLLGLKVDGLVHLPLNCDLNSPLPSLPKVPRILTYFRRGRYHFFRGEVIEEVFRSFPDIEFLIVGDYDKRLEKYRNVKFLGWMKNMDRVYEDVLALIRIPVHDGLSVMVLEALSKGRHVIYSYSFPHCRLAKTANEVKHHLTELLSSPSLNLQGAEWVRRNYAYKKILKEFNNFFEMAINR